MADETKPKNLNPKDNPCDVCGNSSFEWGKPIAGKAEPGEPIYFRPDGSSWEDGDIPLYVRECKICGNIKLFTVES